ncbi:hypothetical protein FJY71_03505 [candidate division WOR-3 bacterium]|nr:hypothetical protein [candidate division WOR-3 bacterium]
MTYRSIRQTLYSDIAFVRLSVPAKLLWHLLKLGSPNMLYLYRPDWDHVRTLMGCAGPAGTWRPATKHQVEAVLTELCRPKEDGGDPWFRYDTATGLVWCVNALTFEFGPAGPNAKQVTAVQNALADLPKSELTREFAIRYAGLSEGMDRVLIPYREGIEGPDTDTDTDTDTSTRRGEPPTSLSELAEHFLGRIAANFPDSRLGKLHRAELPKTKTRKAQLLRRWALALEAQVRLDGVTEDQLRAVIDFVQDDLHREAGPGEWPGWAPNCQCPATLRAKWDRLTFQMERRRRAVAPLPAGTCEEHWQMFVGLYGYQFSGGDFAAWAGPRGFTVAERRQLELHFRQRAAQAAEGRQ